MRNPPTRAELGPIQKQKETRHQFTWGINNVVGKNKGKHPLKSHQSRAEVKVQLPQIARFGLSSLPRDLKGTSV